MRRGRKIGTFQGNVRTDGSRRAVKDSLHYSQRDVDKGENGLFKIPPIFHKRLPGMRSAECFLHEKFHQLSSQITYAGVLSSVPRLAWANEPTRPSRELQYLSVSLATETAAALTLVSPESLRFLDRTSCHDGFGTMVRLARNGEWRRHVSGGT